MKDVEVKLLAELLKDSRRSDRDLAKALGVSQPTVSRMIKRLKENGVIREFTMIPDFRQLGYSMLAFTFVTRKKNAPAEEREKAREAAMEGAQTAPPESIMMESGMGLGYDGVTVSLFKSYADYAKHMTAVKNFPFIDGSKSESFIINLLDKSRYRPLSFRHLAEELTTREAEPEPKRRGRTR